MSFKTTIRIVWHSIFMICNGVFSRSARASRTYRFYAMYGHKTFKRINGFHLSNELDIKLFGIFFSLGISLGILSIPLLHSFTKFFFFIGHLNEEELNCFGDIRISIILYCHFSEYLFNICRTFSLEILHDNTCFQFAHIDWSLRILRMTA